MASSFAAARTVADGMSADQNLPTTILEHTRWVDAATIFPDRTRRWVYAQCKSGRLQARKLGRVWLVNLASLGTIGSPHGTTDDDAAIARQLASCGIVLSR